MQKRGSLLVHLNVSVSVSTAESTLVGWGQQRKRIRRKDSGRKGKPIIGIRTQDTPFWGEDNENKKGKEGKVMR